MIRSSYMMDCILLCVVFFCDYCFVDVGNTGSTYHTGIIWLRRHVSQPLLDLWGENIMNGEFGADQRAIEDAIERLQLANRVSFMPVDNVANFFCFIDGTQRLQNLFALKTCALLCFFVWLIVKFCLSRKTRRRLSFACTVYVHSRHIFPSDEWRAISIHQSHDTRVF